MSQIPVIVLVAVMEKTSPRPHHNDRASSMLKSVLLTRIQMSLLQVFVLQNFTKF